MATKGTAKTTGVYNVSEMLKKAGAGNYTSVQGYTTSTGPNTVHFITARKADNDVAFGHILGSTMSASKDNKVGHANDCAYYSNGYFIAQGGGNFKSTEIVRTDNGLSEIKRFKYTGDLPTITCIAYVGSEHFLVGGGTKYEICKVDVTNKTFVKKSKFEIPDSIENQLKVAGYTLQHQGAYVTGGQLYRIQSYEKNGAITKNKIAVFNLKGKSPLYTGVTLDAVYSCDKTGKKTFEFESISSPNGSSMYVLANVVDGDGTAADRIYSVSFS